MTSKSSRTLERVATAFQFGPSSPVAPRRRRRRRRRTSERYEVTCDQHVQSVCTGNSKNYNARGNRQYTSNGTTHTIQEVKILEIII